MLDRYHTIFVRAGAKLDADGKKRLARDHRTAGEPRHAVLAERPRGRKILPARSRWRGRSRRPSVISCANRRRARRRMLDLPGKHVITLSRSSIEPFLQFSQRRDLREQAFKAWADAGRWRRGDRQQGHHRRDDRASRRTRKASRLRHVRGFQARRHHGEDTGCRIGPAERGLGAGARPRRCRSATIFRNTRRSKGENISIEPWDWRYYAEQVRLARHDLDESVIKTYFQLDRIIEAAFETAHRLFGLSFEELHDFPRYHPDIRAWRVKDAAGDLVGTFIGDYFARSSKRSGAWMSAFRSQERLAGNIRPIIVNVMNFAKGGAGEPSLLSFDDARTLFHEFGHALHGLLSDVTYPLLAGTSVSTDFVELPSQLFEHWLSQPDILRRYATHYRTGEAIPEPLLERLMAARNFNQGFATVEYLASAFVDIALHQRKERRASRRRRPSRRTLSRQSACRAKSSCGTARRISRTCSRATAIRPATTAISGRRCSTPMPSRRSRRPATRSIRTLAARLKRFIYSAGNLRDPAEAYTAFRGKLPTPQRFVDEARIAGAGHGVSGEATRRLRSFLAAAQSPGADSVAGDVRRAAGRRWTRYRKMLSRNAAPFGSRSKASASSTGIPIAFRHPPFGNGYG